MVSSTKIRFLFLYLIFTTLCCIMSAIEVRADNWITLANSVSDFSTTQGDNGWYYGFYDGDVEPNAFLNDDFEQLPVFTDKWNWGGTDQYWTMINPRQQHPGDTYWVVRRWVNPFTGEFKLDWHVDGLESSLAGDGVNAYVILNNEILWSEYIPNGDTVGVDASMSVSLYAGQPIDFAVSPRNNNVMDSTEYNIVILYYETNEVPIFSLKSSSSPGGSITDFDGKPFEGEFKFLKGQNIELNAIADPLYRFSHWSSNDTGYNDANDNPMLVEMTNDIEMYANFVSLLDILYVDANGPCDPAPYDPNVSDPNENGTPEHPFDTIQEAIEVADQAIQPPIIIRPGNYKEELFIDSVSYCLVQLDPNDPNGICTTEE